MNDKIAVVTGGAQGIGRAITGRLSREGYHVVVADIDEEAGNEVARELESEGLVHFHYTDVSRESSVRELMEFVKSGLNHLDLLVNNAGISNPVNGPMENLELAEWELVIQTNLSSVFMCSKYAIPMLRNAGGSIVNIASTRAMMSESNTEAYSAAKGGVVALTHAMANSLGPDIRVNAVSPGWIEVRDWKKSSEKEQPEHREVDNKQHPAGRVGTPNDIASMVSYLAGESAGFITGQNFVVDGGMTRKMIYEH